MLRIIEQTTKKILFFQKIGFDISVGDNFMKCQNLFSEKLFLKIRKIFQNASAKLFTQQAKRNASYVSTESSSICNVTDHVEDFTYDVATQTAYIHEKWLCRRPLSVRL